MRRLFPQFVPYKRFVELEPKIIILFIIFIKKVLLGKVTSAFCYTPLHVC